MLIHGNQIQESCEGIVCNCCLMFTCHLFLYTDDRLQPIKLRLATIEIRLRNEPLPRSGLTIRAFHRSQVERVSLAPAGDRIEFPTVKRFTATRLDNHNVLRPIPASFAAGYQKMCRQHHAFFE